MNKNGRDKDKIQLMSCAFMDTIRGGFEQGAKEAQDILNGMGVLSGDIASNIDKTLTLARQGYDDFETAQRASLANAA